VTLEISDAAGKLVRRYSSADPPENSNPMLAIPKYWVRPQQVLSNAPGAHRFLWDLHYPLVPGTRPTYPIAAVFHDTEPEPSSPWVLPGGYGIKLTAGGRTLTQRLTVKMDPRVHTTAAALSGQSTSSKQIYDDELAALAMLDQFRALRVQLSGAKNRAGSGPIADALTALDQKLTALEGASAGGRGGGGRGAAGGPDTVNSVRAALGNLLRLVEGADVAPTTQEAAAVADRRKAFAALQQRWATLKTQDLSALNAQLKQANLPALTIP
jgi:hypothetical protein